MLGRKVRARGRSLQRANREQRRRREDLIPVWERGLRALVLRRGPIPVWEREPKERSVRAALNLEQVRADAALRVATLPETTRDEAEAESVEHLDEA